MSGEYLIDRLTRAKQHLRQEGVISLATSVPKVVGTDLNRFADSFWKGIERAVVPTALRLRDAEVDLPPWIDCAGSPVSVRSEELEPGVSFMISSDPLGGLGGEAARRPDYFMALPSVTGSEPVVVDPEFEFEGLSFTVLDVGQTDKFRVEVTYETATGGTQTIKREKRSSVGFDFDDELHVPVNLSFDEPVTRAEVRLESEVQSMTGRGLIDRVFDEQWKSDARPWLSVPTPQQSGGMPIVYISVDAFRYDYLDTFEPVVEALGENAVVPAEPRVQGHWTRPSHASTFTSTHPAEHGYIASTTEDIGNHINPELTTLPRILADAGYKCSSCMPLDKLGPEHGFGNGFHRCTYRPISWDTRTDDAADIVNTLIEWINVDARQPSDRLFYFGHIFDAHNPYIPPEATRGDQLIDTQLIYQWQESPRTSNYIDLRNNPLSYDAEAIEVFQTYYRQSLEYVAGELVRLIDHLKQMELFDDALVVISGDHGDDWYERGTMLHQSLYDTNIRQGMIVKPPAEADFSVPDNLDLIDLLPTICEEIGVDPPAQCKGQPMHDHQQRPRITERITSNWYVVAVEMEGVKGIFTYDENYPHRATQEAVKDGPVEEEFYILSEFREHAGDGDHSGIDGKLKTELREIAEEFIASDPNIVHDFHNEGDANAAVQDRLETLGYLD